MTTTSVPTTTQKSLVCLQYVKLSMDYTFTLERPRFLLDPVPAPGDITIGTDANGSPIVVNPDNWQNGYPGNMAYYMPQLPSTSIEPPMIASPGWLQRTKSVNSFSLELIFETGFKCCTKSDEFLDGDVGDTRSKVDDPISTPGRGFKYGTNRYGYKSLIDDIPLKIGSVWYSEMICNTCCESAKSEGISFKISGNGGGYISENNGNAQRPDGRPISGKLSNISDALDQILNYEDNKLYSDILGKEITDQIKNMAYQQAYRITDEGFCGGPNGLPSIYTDMIDSMRSSNTRINNSLIGNFLNCADSSLNQSVCVPCLSLGTVTLDDLYPSQGEIELRTRFPGANTIKDSHTVNTYKQAVLDQEKLSKWIKN